MKTLSLIMSLGPAAMLVAKATRIDGLTLEENFQSRYRFARTGTGFIGGMDTFERNRRSDPDAEVAGTIRFRANCGVLLNIPESEMGPLSDFGATMREVQAWAEREGFVAAFPTFEAGYGTIATRYAIGFPKSTGVYMTRVYANQVDYRSNDVPHTFREINRYIYNNVLANSFGFHPSFGEGIFSSDGLYYNVAVVPPTCFVVGDEATAYFDFIINSDFPDATWHEKIRLYGAAHLAIESLWPCNKATPLDDEVKERMMRKFSDGSTVLLADCCAPLLLGRGTEGATDGSTFASCFGLCRDNTMSESDEFVAQVLIHELAHNAGYRHDPSPSPAPRVCNVDYTGDPFYGSEPYQLMCCLDPGGAFLTLGGDGFEASGLGLTQQCNFNDRPGWNIPCAPMPTPETVPTPFPVFQPREPFPAPCFSSENTVHVQDQGVTRMDSLKIGDMVSTLHGEYTQVYSFGHYDPEQNEEYLQITSKNMDAKPIEISANHLIMVFHNKTGKVLPVAAGDLQMGDDLITENGTIEQVTSIGKIERKGAYAPLTTAGTISVSGIVASNYVAREWLHKDLVSGQLLHWLQHGATLPYRLYCIYLIDVCQVEVYDKITGFSPYVRFWYQLEQWLLGLPTFLQALLLLILVFPALLVIMVGKAATDWSISHFVMMSLILIILKMKHAFQQKNIVEKSK